MENSNGDNSSNINKFEEELEILKLKKEDAQIFSLPPMSSSEGHTTEDFKDIIFRGEMKMFLKGTLMIIYFINPDKTIFTACVTDENIERIITRAKGSTRYFTLKVMNQDGTPSYVGLSKVKLR